MSKCLFREWYKLHYIAYKQKHIQVIFKKYFRILNLLLTNLG